MQYWADPAAALLIAQAASSSPGPLRVTSECHQIRSWNSRWNFAAQIATISSLKFGTIIVSCASRCLTSMISTSNLSLAKSSNSLSCTRSCFSLGGHSTPPHMQIAVLSSRRLTWFSKVHSVSRSLRSKVIAHGATQSCVCACTLHCRCPLDRTLHSQPCCQLSLLRLADGMQKSHVCAVTWKGSSDVSTEKQFAMLPDRRRVTDSGALR